MRPRNQTARDQLATALARRAAAGAAKLAEALGVSVATVHRLLHEQADAVVTTGKARRARYALRRPLRGGLAEFALAAVDAQGLAHALPPLVLVQPQGSCLDLAGTRWPVPEEARDGWWDGLPYPLQDMRPQGYLGRQLARAEHAALGVSPDPQAWSDDDAVQVLSRVGSDCSGDLILGLAAFERWQAQKLAPPEPLPPRALGAAYGRLAEQAVASGVPGSSAAGEFPKFPALRERPGCDTPHVLVKFSGADESAAVRRWADLLVCEHLALEAAGALPGVAAARSRIVEHGGRTFLESERFDRHGLFGRSPLVSLATLDAAFIGAGETDWGRLADRLLALGLIDTDARSCIEQLWWFGRLIANTDMHTGNVSFRPASTSPAQALSLAPVYDMLPMAYAPLPGGEVPPRSYEPALPPAAQREPWLKACAAALAFWQRAAGDGRISDGFRPVCAANASRLRDVAERV